MNIPNYTPFRTDIVGKLEKFVRIDTNKHITFVNFYIPPEDAASPHYTTVNPDLNC